MKIIITETQLKKIYSEQETGFTRRLDRIYSNPVTAAKYNSEIKDFYKKYNHQINTIASIGFSLIPLVGPIIGTAISLADAKQYYNEGNKKTAGMVAMFSMIPLVGPLVVKIPGVKQLGVKGMSALADKLSKGQKLTQSEEQIVLGISANQKLVQAEVSKVSQEMAKKTISKKIATTAVKTGKVVTKKTAPYAASYVAYNKGYDYAQRNTPKTKSEKENFNWESVKMAFGSSGSAEDNTLLNNAWNSGWRPGNVVPKQFQTATYQKNYNQEVENIKALDAMVASIK
jgi:hypothetical protein